MNGWVTDTHALIWHLYNAKRLSDKVRSIFLEADAGECQIVIPAIVLVEIIYLSEKGRINVNAVRHVLALLRSDADNYTVAPLDLNIAAALETVDRAVVPEMPDRIIAATALHLDLPLLTRDSQIVQFSRITTVW
ncbi:MAG: type II toxin-antitoxin system VapC family toxin [Hyphomicrobiales bacterium]|nr:type II toxin-antitoxin system VapC family toxin [Hyphomicrobiales bacterium]